MRLRFYEFVSLDESLPTMSDRHYVHHEDEIALAKLLKESKPFLEKYGTTMIYGVAAILAITAVVVYFQRQPAPTAEVSRDLLLAKTAEDYQAVADEFPDSPIGILSRLRQADSELETAVSSMFTNREAANDSLETAEKAYKQLEDRKDVNDSIRERVFVGLARVAECRCDGSDDTMNAAIAAWQRVLKSFPDSKIFKAAAESRIKRLASEDSRKLYAWFSTQNPKPGDDLLMPQDGLPGPVPAMPTFPSLQNLGLPDFGTPDSKGSSSTEPKKDAEAPDDARAVEDKAGDPPVTPDPAATPDSPAEPAADAPKADEDSPAADAPATTEIPAGDAPAPEKSDE